MAILSMAMPLVLSFGYVLADDTSSSSSSNTGNTQTQQPQSSMRDDMNRQQQQHHMLVRASKTIGMDVYSQQDNKKIGDIEDLVLEPGQNRVSYAVLSYGGIMGMGDKYFAVPWRALEHKSVEPNRVYVNFSEQQLKNAPGFDKNNWPDTSSAEFRQQIDTYYPNTWSNRDKDNDHDRYHDRMGTNDRSNTGTGTGTGMSSSGTGSDTSTANGTSTGTGTGTGTGSTPSNTSANGTNTNATSHDRYARSGEGMSKGLPWNRRASKVLGTNVYNNDDKSLGEIKDLVLDQHSGRVQYAVLDFGGFLGMGDKYFAIPVSQFQVDNRGRDHFVLNVSKDQLKNAPGFDKNNWPDFADAQFRGSVDRFYGNSSSEASTDRD